MNTDSETNDSLDAPTTIAIPEPEPTGDTGGDADLSTDTRGAPASDSGATPEQRATRRERREERARTHKEALQAAATADARLAEFQVRERRMQEQIAELRGRTEQMQRQQAAAAGDPYDKAVADLEERAARHLRAAASATTVETQAAEMREYNKANRQAAVIEARRELQGDFQRFGQSLPDPEMAGMKVTLAAEFPWLTTNEQARTAADGYVGVLVAKGRPANSLATFREASALAAKDFNLGGMSTERPSEARRAAYAGISGREGDGGDGGGVRLQMSSEDGTKLRTLAAQMYPNLDREDAYKKWVREVGPKVARK